jgi:arylsulfatase A-like enzyme
VFRKILDSPWLYFGLAGLLLVGGVLSQVRRVDVDAPPGTVEEALSLHERDRYNVVFILIDTLRADRLSAYGYQRPTSPNLDALAGRGIRFAHVESQSSWTKASMASLWTGLYPQRNGVTRFAHAIPEDAVLPAEIFQEAGYRTAGIWRNGWVANNFGFGQGFDLYYKPGKNRPVDNVRRHNPSAHALLGTDRDATESAAEFIVGAGDDPFLLYVHYMDVHQYLYADTSPDFGSAISDIYDSAIHWTDRNIGQLIDVLRKTGKLDRTWIVVAVDHGEAFFEHGGEGHARNLYGEVQEVPLIIAPPVALDPPVVVEERVANVDIWPTILELVGLPPLPEPDGRSLVPLIAAAAGLGEAPEALRDRPLFAQLDRTWGRNDREPDPMVSVVREDFRLIELPQKPDRRELYDKSTDPKEQTNVVFDREDVATELGQQLEAFLAQPVVWGEAPEIEIDEMKQAQLRALGYVVNAAPKAAGAGPEDGAADAGADEEPAPQVRRRPKRWGED